MSDKHENCYDIDTRTIKIFGDINEDMTSMVHEAISKIKTTHPITVLINSEGGDVLQGNCIYEYLKRTKNDIHTFNIGYASSSSLTVYMAGDKRAALETSRFLFHGVSYTPPEGDSKTINELQNELKELKSMQKDLITIMVENTNKNRAFWNNKAKGTICLSKMEAIDLGIVTEE